MKMGEIWIMKKDVLKDYNDTYEEESGDEGASQEETKVEILDIVDDIIYFVHIFTQATESLSRTAFLIDYEKVYDHR